MAIGFAAIYQIKVDELIAAREAAGGTLSQEEESDHCEELDGYWWQMSNDERERFEELFARKPSVT
jgi:hypothetical protein